MAYQPRPTIIGQLVGMAAEEAGYLGLHGLRQERSCAVAQHIGQQIGKHPWLGQLDEIILGHGVSLLRWRSGGVEHPHDTPPYPFTPSPTSAHNSPIARSQQLAKRPNVIGHALRDGRRWVEVFHARGQNYST